MTTNVLQVLGRMQARKTAVTSELHGAARKVALELNAEAKRIMNRDIYSVEIPFNSRASAADRAEFSGTSTQRSKGKVIRKWRRTGNLLRRERSKAVGTDVVLTNDAAYARPRYTLGTPEGRKIRTPSVRSVQWQEEAVAAKRTFILRVRREAVLHALLRR